MERAIACSARRDRFAPSTTATTRWATALLAAAFLVACGGAKNGDDGADASAPPAIDAASPGPDARVECLPTEVMCGPDCADVSSDNAHCGDCDNACAANQVCTSGICACDAPFITCTQGGENVCVDAATDPLHCGGCDNDCLIGVECISGICQPCDAPRVVCDDTCADLTMDENHCGACGNDCVPGATCTTDATGTFCACPPTDPIACASGCSDLTDDLNCGACGNECVPGSTCEMVGGGHACVCSGAGEVLCPDGCHDLSSDPDNCGACGNSCGPDATCISGGCVCADVGLTHCGSGAGCVDLATDTDHCQACGNDCQDGLQVCGAADCECATGVFPCGLRGPCDDILSDPVDCGATCGAADGNNCAEDEYCSGGACVCRPDYTDFSGNCVDTSTNPLLCGPTGGPTVMCSGMTPQCQDGTCVAACDVGRIDCTGLGPLFSGTCVDPQTDNRHCGGCDNVCGEDEICVGGDCREYRPTGDCTACPCARCDEVFGGAACCDHGTDPICVDAPGCP